jgi:hypothetical protein
MEITGIEEVEAVSVKDLDVAGNSEVVSIGAEDLEVKSVRRVYTLVNDDVYIPTGNYDDAPQWVKDLVTATVNFEVDVRDNSILSNVDSILSLFETGFVPKNEYDNFVVSQQTENSSLNAKFESLNSSMDTLTGTVTSEIQRVDQTYITEDRASTLVGEYIEASITDEAGVGTIGSKIADLSQTVAESDVTWATNYNTLISTLGDESENRAIAVSYLNTRVGVDEAGGLTGTGLLANVEILQKQNDGVIETTTGTYDVMLNSVPGDGDSSDDELVVSAEPYTSWVSEEEAGSENVRLAHIGDVYIKYNLNANGTKEYVASYKFIKTIRDEISPLSTDIEGYTWALVVDQAAQDAYVAALNAYDLADDKRRVFVNLGSTSTPSRPYDQGDLWLIDTERTVNGITCKVGDLLRCIETKGSTASYEQNDWVLASSYQTAVNAEAVALEEWKTAVYGEFVEDIQSQVDSKAESFYTDTMPHPEGTDSEYSEWVGDLWKKPSDNTEYVYDLVNGSYVWVLTDVPDIVYDTIDTKKTIYTGNALPAPVAPTIVEINDMWITGDNPVGGRAAESIYIWDGSVWDIPVKYTDDAAVVALETGLANGTVNIDLTSLVVINGQTVSEYVAEQIDNEVVVYSGTDVTLQTGMKVDDIYIESTTETGTSGVAVDVVNTYKYTGTVWTQINNNDNLTGLADLADGKRTIYSNESNDAPLGELNDIWIPTAGSNDLVYIPGEVYQYNAGWQLATKYTEDLTAFVDEVADTVSGLVDQIDGKIEYWFQDTAPNTWSVADRIKHNKDVWYNTATDISYYYISATNSWNKITDSDAIQALEEAAVAQETADGKVTTFYQEDAPIAEGEGDIWIDSDDNNKMYRWNGISWQDNSDKRIVANAEAVTQLEADLNDGEGTWLDADNQVTQSLNTSITNGMAEVESKWEYNSVIGINGIYKKSGFGLTTNYTSGSGTEVDPYVSEFWIDASRLKFTNSNVTGQVFPFTIDASGVEPKVAFNGEVAFSNVTGYTPPDVSGDITANNDIIAQSLGFNSYDDMVNNAQLGKTLISGGYINTGLVDADSLKADSAMIKKLLAQNIVMDTNVAESKITSADGSMVIDFKNGSIYIA